MFVTRFALLAICILLFSGCTSQENQINMPMDPKLNDEILVSQIPTNLTTVRRPFVENGVFDPEVAQVNAVGADSFSGEMLHKIYAFAEETDNGVKMIKTGNDFTSGRLEYTITNVSLVKELEAINVPVKGFTYENRFALSEKGESTRLECIQNDGTLATGWSFILIDLLVESIGAEKDTTAIGSYDDAFLFRADDLLWLCDFSQENPKNNYRTVGLDYFSKLGEFSEHECVFRIEPGETITFSIGFLIGEREFDYLIGKTKGDLTNIRACNTTGNKKSVFINLNLGDCE